MSEPFYVVKGQITEVVTNGLQPPVITSADCVSVVPASPIASNAILLTAATYGVLAQSAITNTGNTVITGDLGISPAAGSFVTGFPPGLVSGVEHLNDAAAAQAHVDVTAAAATLTAMGPGTDLSATDFGGHTCVPGVYHTTAAVTWSAGNLTLNGAGTYVFLIGSALTMPANASVLLTGGATANNVYFVTGTTFIFGADCVVNGNILAGSAITFASNSVLHGRALTYGVSGTAITFPSAAVVSVPAGASGAFSYQITALNFPTAFYATYLPYTLTLNKSTGLITGTMYANSIGEFRVPLQATNDVGVGTMILTIFA
jgi:hypothetical protein